MKRRKSYPSLLGNKVAISGATGGLGRHLCRRLCALGADLYLLDRNPRKSNALINELKADFPDAVLHHITVDMEDTDRVLSVAEELRSVGIDALILNAGAYSIPRHTCSCGYDNVFTINFISPYLLAEELLPLIEAKGGRVVVVGSIAHNYSKVDREDIDFSRRKAASKVYGNAKRYLMYSLCGRPNVSVTHPGIAVTGITGHYPKLIYAIIKYPMKLIFMSPEKASLCILEGVFQSTGENQWIGPWIFNIWGRPKLQRLRTADSAEKNYIRQAAEELRNEIKMIKETP